MRCAYNCIWSTLLSICFLSINLWLSIKGESITYNLTCLKTNVPQTSLWSVHFKLCFSSTMCIFLRLDIKKHHYITSTQALPSHTWGLGIINSRIIPRKYPYTRMTSKYIIKHRWLQTSSMYPTNPKLNVSLFQLSQIN